MEDSQDTHSSSLQTQLCHKFSFSEIQMATHEFDEGLIIGRGGFGNVYKASIKIGETYVVAAIKRLNSNSNQGATEFWAEVEMLSKLRHCNLASLIGYCDERKEMILLYEYMPQGTLEGCLYKSGSLLTWVQRLKICIGAARGLDYLHTGTGTKHGVIHRDVKSSNILLDENYAAKISDFGLAKEGPINQTHTSVTTRVKGTFGYMDPQYFYTNKLTRKSDVYAFGVVLFEVLCGRPAVDTSLDEEQWGLALWAQDRIREGKLARIIDTSLRGQISIDCLKEFARVAISCLHTRPNQRPTMAEVVTKLEYASSIQKGMPPYTKIKLSNKIWSVFTAHVRRFKKLTPFFLAVNDQISLNINKVANTPVGSVGSIIDAGSESGGELVCFDGRFDFTLTDLLTSSAKFLSENPFWRTYTVFLPDGFQVVVKRILTRLNQKKFVRTVSVLGKIRHPNVLDLKAYYWGRGESLCVFKFMPNGSLASLIQSASENLGGSKTSFDWLCRISIITGVTRGLFYLHNQERIVHGDLKSSMIMLDENDNPMISNVGLSWLMPTTSQRFRNNCAPEFTGSANATAEIDVYSLGIIMLQLLTGESLYRSIHPVDLPTWVKSIPKEKWSVEVFDKNLVVENPNKRNALIKLMKLAIRCVEYDPKARPRVQDVLQTLEQIQSY